MCERKNTGYPDMWGSIRFSWFYEITLTICLTDTVIITDWKYLCQTAISCDGQPHDPVGYIGLTACREIQKKK